MNPIIVNAVAIKGQFVILKNENIADIKPDAIHKWEFNVKPFDGYAAQELGRIMNASNVYNAQGLGDQLAISVTRSLALLESTFESGAYYSPDAPGLPLSVGVLAGLPAAVLVSAGNQIQTGPQLTEEDIESLKNVPTPA
jgi:hypothetical protein